MLQTSIFSTAQFLRHIHVQSCGRVFPKYLLKCYLGFQNKYALQDSIFNAFLCLHHIKSIHINYPLNWAQYMYTHVCIACMSNMLNVYMDMCMSYVMFSSIQDVCKWSKIHWLWNKSIWFAISCCLWRAISIYTIFMNFWITYPFFHSSYFWFYARYFRPTRDLMMELYYEKENDANFCKAFITDCECVNL